LFEGDRGWGERCDLKEGITPHFVDSYEQVRRIFFEAFSRI
jgi:hypothetical protein